MIELLLEKMERVRRGEKDGSMYLTDHPSPQAGPSRLSRVISVGSGRYMLVAAPPGTGKTSLVDNMILKAILANLYGQGESVNVIYRSMERSKEEKLAKLASALIFMDRQVIIDPSTMLGYSNAPRPLHDEDIKLVKEYEKHFQYIGTKLDIISGADTPSNVLKYAMDQAASRGTYFHTAGGVLMANKDVVGPFDKVKKVAGVEKRYRETSMGDIYENEPKFFPRDKGIYIHVVDHIGKLVGNDHKATIEQHSNNMANIVRDLFRYFVIDIIQLNRDIYDTYRQNKERLTIKPSDFKGSNVPVENADIALGILDPHAMKTHDWEGYDIQRFVDPKTNFSRFRALIVIKNSQGGNSVNIPLAFYGENGMTYEIPSPMAINETHFERIMKAEYLPFQ